MGAFAFVALLSCGLAGSAIALVTAQMGFRVHLLLVGVVYFAVILGGPGALWAGFFAGLLQDALSASRFGPGVASLTLCALLVHGVSKSLFWEKRLTRAFVVFLSFYFSSAVFLFLSRVTGSVLSVRDLFSGRFLLSASFTALCAPFVMDLLQRVKRGIS